MIATSNTNNRPTCSQDLNNNYNYDYQCRQNYIDEFDKEDYWYLPTEQDLFLENKGAFYQWIWCVDRYIWSFCYWIKKEFIRQISLVFIRRPMVIFAGFMSQDRGKHWHRYDRIRRK